MSEKEFEKFKIAGYPIMLAIIEKIELKKILSRHLKSHGNEKISTVDTLIMILFNIICGRQPMYELSEWVSKIHPQCFGLAKLDVNILNDDRFGRAVESICNADRASIITEVILKVIEVFKIVLDQLHNDSTSIKSYSKMSGKTKSGLELKRGKSKDHRPDLKQLIYTLTISADGAIPIHYKTYSGNRTDDTTHIETWNTLHKLVGRANFLYVADCKVCTKSQLKHITGKGGRVVTIMPESWGEVQDFKQDIRKHKKTKQEILRRIIPGTFDETEYFYQINGDYKTKDDDYNIHWIFSSEKKKRDLLSREKALKQTERELADLVSRINKRNLKTKKAIEAASLSILNKRKVERFYHFSVEAVKEKESFQIGKGRPGQNTKYRECINTIYTLSWTRKKQELKSESNIDGIFPLLSTDDTLTAKEALVAYKYQPRLEKRFEHLKSVLLAAPLLFKKIERVEGMMFMYFLGLLVQALIEREVRQAMKQEDIEKLFIYPEERASMAPTTSIILDRFEDIFIYKIKNKGKEIEKYKDELNETQKQILALLDIKEEEFWFNKI